MDKEYTVTFQKWKTTIAKWEFEVRFEGLLEQVISILLFIVKIKSGFRPLLEMLLSLNCIWFSFLFFVKWNGKIFVKKEKKYELEK